MFCPNCGEKNCAEVAKEHSNVFVERGDYDSSNNTYSMEQEATVLACSACNQEFIAI